MSLVRIEPRGVFSENAMQAITDDLARATMRTRMNEMLRRIALERRGLVVLELFEVERRLLARPATTEPV